MRPILLLALSGCGANDIVGPFSGPVARFAVDSITLPTKCFIADQLGDDLDGDRQHTIDNQLGCAIAGLYLNDDATTHAADMIASGAIASFVELQAPDLTNATKAGATYFGSDGADAVVMGGDIVDGVFVSNRTRSTHAPGMAIVHLPVFADADPSVIELDAMELDLTPDGNGGYDALVRGGVREDDVVAVVCDGIQQMIYNDPTDHYYLAALIDGYPFTGWLSCNKIHYNSFLAASFAADVTVDGVLLASIGFAVHLTPCDSGACAKGPIADPCHDRVQDGDETGIDCGGSCGPCRVVPPSCSDGVRDGLETDVDCGWNCGKCAIGQHCYSNLDCASGTCSDGNPGLRTCITTPAQ